MIFIHDDVEFDERYEGVAGRSAADGADDRMATATFTKRSLGVPY
jgi:hypothetical protein